jgi:hypothetical protein
MTVGEYVVKGTYAHRTLRNLKSLAIEYEDSCSSRLAMGRRGQG